MRLLSFILCLIMSLQSYAADDYWQKKKALKEIIRNDNTIDIFKLDNFEKYSHYQDAEEVRKFIHFAIDILTEKNFWKMLIFTLITGASPTICVNTCF